MPEMVKEAELILSKTTSSSVDVEKFRDYVKARASVIPILKEYYGNETLNTTQTYFPGSCTKFSIRGRRDLYFEQLFVTRIRGYYPQKKKDSPDSSNSLYLYASYLEIITKQKHILQRLNATTKDSMTELVAKMFDSNGSNDLKQLASTQLEKLQILPFRKMRFSNKLYLEKNDCNLVKRLRANFDWSAPNVKHQEPTSKGLISMLRKKTLKFIALMNLEHPHTARTAKTR